MYLKEIEIQGFKSFADKTKVVFDQGVTAVVGPNGSGKSNITESLRWALGESSVKSCLLYTSQVNSTANSSTRLVLSPKMVPSKS